MSNIPTPTYNLANIVPTKNAIILDIMHTIFNIRDTEIVICIILIILKRANGLKQ